MYFYKSKIITSCAFFACFFKLSEALNISSNKTILNYSTMFCRKNINGKTMQIRQDLQQHKIYVNLLQLHTAGAKVFPRKLKGLNKSFPPII